MDVGSFKVTPNDTTSLPYNIAYWTARILLLSDTVIEQRKNMNAKRYLQIALQTRHRCCRKLYKKDPEVFRKVVAKLGITKAVDPVLNMKRSAKIFDLEGFENRRKLNYLAHD